jgi:hypothetical protein
MIVHGKRSGIEHFVKIIVWAGRDKGGKRVLKNICLDVDKSNHAAKDCASAIKMSVKKPKITGLDILSITFHAITGNSGGGGVVQHIHPLLKMNKTTSKESKRLNCQCHALRKAFENACINTFGK